MCRVLLTAFEPYDVWPENSSWLALIELTKDLPQRPHVTTRRYPVDYGRLEEQLPRDLTQNYDYVIHLGQSPGSPCIQLESVALNHATNGSTAGRSLVPDGPVAYRTGLPVDAYCHVLKQAGFPARVSFHAGTYLCNAALYLSHHISAVNGLATKAMFVHLPLDMSQTASQESPAPCLSSRDTADALRLLLKQISAKSQPG